MPDLDPLLWFVLAVFVSGIVVLTVDAYVFHEWSRRAEKQDRVRKSDRFVEEFFSNKRSENHEDDRQA